MRKEGVKHFTTPCTPSWQNANPRLSPTFVGASLGGPVGNRVGTSVGPVTSEIKHIMASEALPQDLHNYNRSRL